MSVKMDHLETHMSNVFQVDGEGGRGRDEGGEVKTADGGTMAVHLPCVTFPRAHWRTKLYTDSLVNHCFYLALPLPGHVDAHGSRDHDGRSRQQGSGREGGMGRGGAQGRGGMEGRAVVAGRSSLSSLLRRPSLPSCPTYLLTTPHLPSLFHSPGVRSLQHSSSHFLLTLPLSRCMPTASLCGSCSPEATRSRGLPGHCWGTSSQRCGVEVWSRVGQPVQGDSPGIAGAPHHNGVGRGEVWEDV